MAAKKPRRNLPQQRRAPVAQRPAAPARVTLDTGIPQIQATFQVETRSHQGPLPDPDTLARYEAGAPGSAERIIRMAERPLEMAEQQQAHRIDLEKRVIRSDIRRGWAGLIVGGILAAAVVTAGIIFTVQGRTTVGLAALLTPLAGLVGTFIYTDRQRRKERNATALQALTQ